MRGMMSHMGYQQVIITGASSGFGEAFARRLAGDCHQMVLVARRTSVLKQLAEELMFAHPTLEVLVETCDLSSEAERAALVARLQRLPAGSKLLINNAGLGDYGEFHMSEMNRNRQMLQVNVAAPVELVHALLPAMKEKGGAIINIASLAADLAIPDFAVYAATKSFVTSFSEALRMELKAHAIAVTAVCPGPVHTGFGDVARRPGFSGNEMPLRQWFYTTVQDVVNESVEAVKHNKPRCYPSWRITLAGFLVRNLPLCLLRLLMGWRPRKVKKLPNQG